MSLTTTIHCTKRKEKDAIQFLHCNSVRSTHLREIDTARDLDQIPCWVIRGPRRHCPYSLLRKWTLCFRIHMVQSVNQIPLFFIICWGLFHFIYWFFSTCKSKESNTSILFIFFFHEELLNHPILTFLPYPCYNSCLFILNHFIMKYLFNSRTI